MSLPIFFPRGSPQPIPNLRPLEECAFNQIELRCPRCTTKQWYINTEINGDKTVVCDYCSFEIPFKYDNNYEWCPELTAKYIKGHTVINRR